MRNREPSPRILTRGRVAAFVVAALVVAGTSLFFVRARSDLHGARDGLDRSQQHLVQLDGEQRDAVASRTRAFTALAQARELLRTDTAATERLRATNRAELTKLAVSLQTLSRHRDELAAGAARAKLLDDCLVGASQVLNEAAVGDVGLLATTLPPVQRLCSQAAA